MESTIETIIQNFGAAGILMIFAFYYLWSNHQSKKRSDDLMSEALALNLALQKIQQDQNKELSRTRDRIADALEAMNRRHDILEINIARHATDVAVKFNEIKKVIEESLHPEEN